MLVVLGPPGSGKSTLERRFELDIARTALEERDDSVTFYVSLNHYRPAKPCDPLPEPGGWLAERWRARFPELPALRAFPLTF